MNSAIYWNTINKRYQESIFNATYVEHRACESKNKVAGNKKYKKLRQSRLVCMPNRTETARRERLCMLQSFVLTKQDRYRLRCAYEGEKVPGFEEIRNRYVTRTKYGRICVCVCVCTCNSFWIFITSGLPWRRSWARRKDGISFEKVKNGRALIHRRNWNDSQIKSACETSKKPF